MTEGVIVANEKWYAFRELPIEGQKELIKAKRANGMTEAQIQKEFAVDKSTWLAWLRKNKMWANGRARDTTPKSKKKRDTLCWECEKCGGRCSWSKDLTPVKGWVAEETNVPEYIAALEKIVPNVTVIECPEFVRG